MENHLTYPVLIIGAGPAGLTLGYWLKKEGVQFQIIEKSYVSGASWAVMPDHLHLISLWHSNCLVKTDLEKFDRFKNHTAQEFAEYLSGFARRFDIPVMYQTAFQSIHTTGDSFEVLTNAGTINARLVIDCRGYFSFPFMPSFPGKTSIQQLHFNDFKNAQSFSGKNTICLIGKRLSAGQVIEELCEANPEIKIYLVARSPVKFSPPMAILKILLMYLNWFEWIPAKLKVKKTAEIPMHASIKKYFEKNVIIKNKIISLKEDSVVFEDEEVKIDSIVFATGYKRELINLKNDFESSTMVGYFYLGIDGQRTFSSRFLRGIRADAPILARLIRGRLASRNNCQ